MLLLWVLGKEWHSTETSSTVSDYIIISQSYSFFSVWSVCRRLATKSRVESTIQHEIRWENEYGDFLFLGILVGSYLFPEITIVRGNPPGGRPWDFRYFTLPLSLMIVIFDKNLFFLKIFWTRLIIRTPKEFDSCPQIRFITDLATTDESWHSLARTKKIKIH